MYDLPVLEPDLDLAGAETGNLSGQSFSVSCVWVCLTGEFAHEESSLVVGKSEPLHLSLRCPDLRGCHGLSVFALVIAVIAIVLVVVEDEIIVLVFKLFYIAVVVGRRGGQSRDWAGRSRASKGYIWHVVLLNLIKSGWRIATAIQVTLAVE
jgi:hypothetical protein